MFKFRKPKIPSIPAGPKRHWQHSIEWCMDVERRLGSLEGKTEVMILLQIATLGVIGVLIGAILKVQL